MSASPPPERYCPTGNHWRLLRVFRTSGSGKPARDCLDCERQRRERANAKPEAQRFDGVDIDAIHYKRGAVAPHLRGRGNGKTGTG